MLVAGKFAWVPHVKLPVKCLWYSGKFTCARRQFACVLREVLVASKQVNLPVLTCKLHVTQVNCARDLFTCELHVKLPAFAGNFARASFTVYSRAIFLQQWGVRTKRQQMQGPNNLMWKKLGIRECYKKQSVGIEIPFIDR